jgi:hypothetical protein
LCAENDPRRWPRVRHSSEHFLQDRNLETQVGDEPLRFGIPLLELLPLTNFRDTHRAELFLPPVKHLLNNVELAVDLRDRLSTSAPAPRRRLSALP